MSGGTYLSDHAMAIAVINAQQTEIERLREAIKDIITIIPTSPSHALEVAHRALK